MFKTILKVIYIAFTVFVAFMVYSSSYSANADYKKLEKVQHYLENEDYDQLGRLASGYYNSVPVISGADDAYKNDKVQIRLYEGNNETFLKYYTPKGEKDKDGNPLYDENVYHAYDKSYYLYLFDVSFSTLPLESSPDKNSTALVFYGDNGATYNYKFNNTPTINKDTYNEKPASLSEASLNMPRDMENFYKKWQFRFFPLDETLINSVEEKLGSDIKGFNLIDNESKPVFRDREYIEFDFSFESQFYTESAELYELYDNFLPKFDDLNVGKIEKDEYKVAEDIFAEGKTKFEARIRESHPQYLFGFLPDEIYTSDVLWKTIGETVLYCVCVIIIYILLFNFKFVNDSYHFIMNKLRGKNTKMSVKEEAIDPYAKPFYYRHDPDAIDEPKIEEPVEAEAVEATPVEAEPVEAEKVEAEPVEAEKVDAEPVEAESVEAEVADAEVVGPKENKNN